MNLRLRSKIPGIGGKGENLAIAYLKTKQYRIIQLNYRTKYGEIDIIAKTSGGTMVFIEVKTLSGKLNPETSLLPEDNLSNVKLKKLKRICQFFANANPELIEEMGWRIDLIAIILWDSEHCRLKHYENLY